ncbi:MAG: sugar ABC transporter permease [Candidatus Eisenbacteria bacterium]|nr:sugar ABC transporter permease [Candidatus Eisenbacteria bacterium]
MRHLTKLISYAILILASAASIYPIVQVIGISLRPDDRLFSTSLAIIPERATFHAYYAILFEKDFLLWLRNSSIVALFVTILGVSLASTSGYAFSRFRFKGHSAGLFSFLVTQMFPATMLLLPLYVLMRQFHLLNSLLGLVVAYTVTALPFCVWTMKGYYDTIPRELEEAALVDGSGEFGAFLRIILPVAAPGLAITALFSFMSAWSEYIVARVILSDKGLFTLPLGLEGLSGTYQTEWANYAAGSILVSLPVVAVFLFLARFLVSGLTLGAVKE